MLRGRDVLTRVGNPMNLDRPHMMLGFDADRTPDDAAALTIAFVLAGHRCYALWRSPREIAIFHMTDNAEALVLAADWFSRWEVLSA